MKKIEVIDQLVDAIATALAVNSLNYPLPDKKIDDVASVFFDDGIIGVNSYAYVCAYYVYMLGRVYNLKSDADHILNYAIEKYQNLELNYLPDTMKDNSRRSKELRESLKRIVKSAFNLAVAKMDKNVAENYITSKEAAEKLAILIIYYNFDQEVTSTFKDIMMASLIYIEDICRNGNKEKALEMIDKLNSITHTTEAKELINASIAKCKERALKEIEEKSGIKTNEVLSKADQQGKPSQIIEPFNNNESRALSTKENKIKETNTSARIMFCRKCGAKLLPDSKFCNMCGCKII